MMYGSAKSWRAVMAKSAVTALVVLAIAALVYPESLVWVATVGVTLAAAQLLVLAAVWHRFERRLRSAGFDW